MFLKNVKKVRSIDLNLKEKLITVKRVTKVTKGGRHFSFSALVVVGDGNGKVGFALGKSKEVTAAITKATEKAKKNIIEVKILKGTIPHEVYAKFGAAKVLIKPASEGTGIKAGGAMRAVLELAGIKNVLAKNLGSTNPHNVLKATFLALSKLRDPYTIARQRGIPLEKVFNG